MAIVLGTLGTHGLPGADDACFVFGGLRNPGGDVATSTGAALGIVRPPSPIGLFSPPTGPASSILRFDDAPDDGALAYTSASGANVLVLKGVTAADLDQSDFIF